MLIQLIARSAELDAAISKLKDDYANYGPSIPPSTWDSLASVIGKFSEGPYRNAAIKRLYDAIATFPYEYKQQVKYELSNRGIVVPPFIFN